MENVITTATNVSPATAAETGPPTGRVSPSASATAGVDTDPGAGRAGAPGGAAAVRRELVRAWVDGWSRSRGVAAAIEVPGGFRVEDGAPGRPVRYVLPAADETVLRDLVGGIVTPGVRLKVCASRERVVPLLTGAWEVGEPEFLMTAALSGLRVGPAAPASAPQGYVIESVARDGAIDVRIRSGGGTAAAGRVALARSVAVFDQVHTDPAHRRRGLGRRVMAALSAIAAEQGAALGVLVATEEGRALYRSIGWDLQTPMTTAVLR
ncbi:GNAT family N-acetyltransferase [Streptomyces sp. NPDC018031]|uniref:GNAT family N-acetyltransferase n=1 Tax=Streptomyces sp. NPDC018031 TaxID=3365033 RepID=UPI00378AB31E